MHLHKYVCACQIQIEATYMLVDIGVDFGGSPSTRSPPQIGERPCIYQFLTLFSPQNLGLCPIFLTSLRQCAWMHAYLYANVCTFVCIHLQTRTSTEAASVDVLL